jgi:hypothetical protein
MYPEHLALAGSSFPNSSRTIICDVFAVCRFSDRLPSEISMIRKHQRIRKKGKLIKQKLSIFSQLCRIMTTDALQVRQSSELSTEKIYYFNSQR